MEYFAETSDENTNGKCEISVENTIYNKLKIIKAIDNDMVTKTKKLKRLKWKNVSGVKPHSFSSLTHAAWLNFNEKESATFQSAILNASRK